MGKSNTTNLQSHDTEAGEVNPQDVVRAIYPESYIHEVENRIVGTFYGVYIRKQPKGTRSTYPRLIGTGNSEKAAWNDAMLEVNKQMLEKLES